MQRWYPFLTIIILALLLTACDPYSEGQAGSAQAAQLPRSVAQHTDPTATAEVSATSSTVISTT